MPGSGYVEQLVLYSAIVSLPLQIYIFGGAGASGFIETPIEIFNVDAMSVEIMKDVNNNSVHIPIDNEVTAGCATQVNDSSIIFVGGYGYRPGYGASKKADLLSLNDG